MEAKTLALLSVGITIVIIAFIGWVLWRIFFRQPTAPETEAETKKETPQPAGDTKNFWNDILKSFIHFLITVPATIIYFWQAPKILCLLIESMSLQWAYVISALLFVPIISVAYYLWGEHWPVGKKQQGFALVAIVALVISLLYIYYPEKIDGNGSGIKGELQIVPQTSYGWKIDSDGRLVANLQIGEEASRVFRMSEGYSTPWFVLPPKGYRFRADYQQAVIVEEKGRGKKIVSPNDTDNRGVTQGQHRQLRFTALKGGAEITITLRRI